MKDFDKKIVITACILAAVTIAIGAFGAHGLKQLVNSDSLLSFETGVRYQMYHVFALFLLGLLSGLSVKTKKIVFWLFVFGIILFSGSIYLLALKELVSFNVTFLGPFTPLGGFLFILGWLLLAYKLLTQN